MQYSAHAIATGSGDHQNHTDEGQLQRETDWLLVKKQRTARKRKAEESPELESQKQESSSIITNIGNIGSSNISVQRNRKKH